jgi:hypothetical protein
MKIYPLVTFLAAFVAFVFAPLSFEAASSLLFIAGFGCVLIADYTRQPRSRMSRGPSFGRLSHGNRELASAFELAA